MDLGAYVTSPDGLDWATMLAPWEHLLPAELTVWFVNRFGEALFTYDDGSIHLLDLEADRLVPIASSKEDLIARAKAGESVEGWLCRSDVDAAARAGLALGPGQCLGFKTPLLLGGKRTLANTRIWDLPVYYAFLGDVHQQTRHLPDGARVRLRPRSSDAPVQ